MKIGVVGYSTRALIEALVELDYQAIAIDAFCDQDTLEFSEACGFVADWPGGVVAAAKRVQVDAWLLAGGMENHPQIVEQLHALAPVLGPNAATLIQVRTPKFWDAICKGINSLAFPGCTRIRTPQRSDVTGSWTPQRSENVEGDDGGEELLNRLEACSTLFKPWLGAGGMRVATEQVAGVDGYWQPFIRGRSIGVTFILGDDEVRLLGATHSLSAEQWPGPTPFIYRGSLGPIQLSPAQSAAALAMAARVAAALPGYRGWLQADFIQDADDRLWLLELNPRWTAGMEVLQLCRPAEISPLVEHLKCFGIKSTGDARNAGAISYSERPKTMLKAIVYAPRDLWLTRQTRVRLFAMRGWQSLPGLTIELSLSDLPGINGLDPVFFEAGSPILTVRLRGSAK